MPFKREEEISTVNNVPTFLPPLNIIISIYFVQVYITHWPSVLTPENLWQSLFTKYTAALHSQPPLRSEGPALWTWPVRRSSGRHLLAWPVKISVSGLPSQCYPGVWRQRAQRPWTAMLNLWGHPVADPWSPESPARGELPPTRKQLFWNLCDAEINFYMFDPLYIVDVFVKVIHMTSLVRTFVLQWNGHNNHSSFPNCEFFKMLIGWFYPQVDSFRKSHNNKNNA